MIPVTAKTSKGAGKVEIKALIDLVSARQVGMSGTFCIGCHQRGGRWVQSSWAGLSAINTCVTDRRKGAC